MRDGRQLKQIFTRWQMAEQDKAEPDYELLASMLRRAGWRKEGERA